MTDQMPSSDPSTEESASDGKPWFKRWWGIALIVLGALIMVQALAGGDGEQAEPEAVDETADADDEAEEAADEAAEEAVEVEVPDVAGEALPDARSTLADLGLETDEVDVDEDRTVFSARNWEVESQSPEPGTTLETGDPVTLDVFRPQDREDADDGAMPVEEVIERANCIEVEYHEPGVEHGRLHARGAWRSTSNSAHLRVREHSRILGG
jgi:hypothetical protein